MSDALLSVALGLAIGVVGPLFFAAIRGLLRWMFPIMKVGQQLEPTKPVQREEVDLRPGGVTIYNYNHDYNYGAERSQIKRYRAPFEVT